MPGSTVSLESLSSPSPSPPPPEEQQEQHSNHSGGAGLDSGSELSELTEEEQDNDSRSKEDTPRSAARKKKQRDRIVPQPMWDWVKQKPEKRDKSEKKDRPDWRTKLIEEEEEEEQAGPAKAMEEEEDDDQDKDYNSDRDVSLEREDGALSDNEADDNDEDDPVEDDGEFVDEVPSRNSRKPANGDVSGEENDDPDDADPDASELQQSPKAVASPDLTDDENENENVGEDELDEDEAQDVIPTTKEGSEVDEDEDEAVVDDVDIPDVDEPPTTEAVTPAEGVLDTVDLDPDATMDVDAPPPVLMSPVAVAASSIMAGASVIQPPSPSSSQPSTPSISRISSRFQSAEQEPEPEPPSEHEIEPQPERKPSGRGTRSRKGKGRTRAPRRSRAAVAVEVGEVELDADQGELQDGEPVDGDEDVATPELDLDSDMQPAHRAEALDVLAAIELKFALLRERLYVEKMDSLAWEEGLIADGTHPELLHLHAELSNRRDKRLELAARRRDYEAANVTKRRRLDEAGAWSTWSNERDELQAVMIAETSGKKRKLERERRILERPQPARRFPLPLHDVLPAPSLREIVRSSPFGLPESASSLTKRSQRKKEQMPQIPVAYPSLAPLSRNEILQDLDLFYSHRHVPIGFDPHRHMPGLMNAVLGGMSQGIDPYSMGMPLMDGPGHFAPPMHQQHIQQQGMIQGFVPPRLPHHHSAPPGALPHVGHGRMQMEQDLQMRQHPSMPSHPAHMQQPFGAGPGPGTLMRRSISPVPLSNGIGLNSVQTTLGGGPIPPGFSGSKPNGWSGPPSSGKDSKRMNGDSDGRDRERMIDGNIQRERAERERAQRDVERERESETERTYLMSHAQSRHGAHPHPYPHVHGSTPAQTAHHHNLHSHQHHHHHVHHHHHPPPHQTFPGTGGNIHAPPMAGLPPGASVAPPVQALSPHGGREFDQRRPRSSAPTEIIELSAPTQKQLANSPSMSAFWKGGENPFPPPHSQSIDNQLHREWDRERTAGSGPLGPPPPEVHERLMTPFTMGPTQALQPQPSLPGSPRKTLGFNTAPSSLNSNLPSSMPSSRRGSWSAAVERDDHDLARISSGPTGPGIPPAANQRPQSSRFTQPPLTSSFHGQFGSPPHSNGRALPTPSSPSAFAGPLRSPVRTNQQGLGGPLSPPPSLPRSPGLMASPGSKLPRAPSPGVLPKSSLPKMGGFPIPESGNVAPIATGVGGLVPPPAGVSSLPPPTGVLPPLPTTVPAPGLRSSRMPNGALPDKAPGAQAQLPGAPPATKIVSVDGS